MNPLAELTIEDHDGFQLARIDGEIDLSNASQLLDRLLAAISNQSHSVILDLSATGYLDSAGLRLVFETRRALGARRQQLRVVAPPNTFVADVLHATRLGDSIPIDPSLSDSLDAVARSATRG